MSSSFLDYLTTLAANCFALQELTGALGVLIRIGSSHLVSPSRLPVPSTCLRRAWLRIAGPLTG